MDSILNRQFRTNLHYQILVILVAKYAFYKYCSQHIHMFTRTTMNVLYINMDQVG